MASNQSDCASPCKRRRFLQLVGGTGAGVAIPLSVGATAQDSGQNDEYETRQFSVTATDGTSLRGHVHLPTDLDPPLAPVVNLSPYWNTAFRGPSSNPTGPPQPNADPGAENDSSRTFSHGYHRFQSMLGNGFALATVNLRGTGLSDGCFQYGSPIDVDDARTIVEAIADLEWSNGNVGMIGGSYDGWAQTMAIAGDAPSLEAVVPISSVIDVWSVFTFTGAPWICGPTFRTAWDALTSVASLPPQPDHVTCPQRPSADVAHADLAVSGDKSEYFELRDYRDELANSRVPMFVTNGLDLDRPVPEGHIQQVDGLYESRPPKTTRMILGQWGHMGTPEGFLKQVVAWFDHYLRNGPREVPPGVVRYEDDTGTWHTTDQWPPEGNQQSVYLSNSSLIMEKAAVETSRQRFQSEYTNPGLSPEACGPRQAIYASPPLEEGVEMAGYFNIHTTLKSTGPGGHFAAFLYHTPGDGICPDRNVEVVSRALADLRHWKTPGYARPFPIGEPTPVSFKSIPFATNISAGQRLVLAIGGGAERLFPDQLQPTLTVISDPDLPGSLELPIVEGDLEFATADSPLRLSSSATDSDMDGTHSVSHSRQEDGGG